VDSTPSISSGSVAAWTQGWVSTNTAKSQIDPRSLGNTQPIFEVQDEIPRLPAARDNSEKSGKDIKKTNSVAGPLKKGGQLVFV
jgi:hypothetical protein